MSESRETQDMVKEYLSRVTLPLFEDFQREGEESNKELQELWEKNHQALLEVIKNFKIPFFGLHGTSQENFQKIEKKNDAIVEISTFYARPEDPETFLTNLYIIAGYSLQYGFFKHRGKEGCIAIFSVEEDGENASFPAEPLKFLSLQGLEHDGEGMRSVLEKVQQCVKEINAHKNDENYLTSHGIPFRASLTPHLGQYSYSGVLKGAYSEGSEKFRKDLSEIGPPDLAKEILRHRFWMQEILKNVFEKLEVSPR